MTDPASQRTLPRMVAAAVARYGARPAIEDGDVRLTFAVLTPRAGRACSAHSSPQACAGDRVAIWGAERRRVGDRGSRIQTIGAILVPISTQTRRRDRLRAPEERARLLCTGAVFIDSDYVGMLGGPRLPAPRAVRDGARQRRRARRFGATSSPGRGAARVGGARARRRRGPHEVADMLSPSGRRESPRRLLRAQPEPRAFEVWSGWVGLREGDRYLVVSPFFHSFGYKAGWLSAIMRGADDLPASRVRREAVLERIERERDHGAAGSADDLPVAARVPTWRDYDLSSLRLAVTGAAAVPVELVHQMHDELGFETVLTAYGLTESCGVVSICEPGDDPETIATTSGKAIPGTEVRCVDPDGKEVPRGQPGEIWVRGYNVMRGYFDADEQTREAIDAEGWLHTATSA
jgi:hypothetical protein